MDYFTPGNIPVVESPMLKNNQVLGMGNKLYVGNLYSFIISTFGVTEQSINACCEIALNRVMEKIDKKYGNLFNQGNAI